MLVNPSAADHGQATSGCRSHVCDWSQPVTYKTKLSLEDQVAPLGEIEPDT